MSNKNKKNYLTNFIFILITILYLVLLFKIIIFKTLDSPMDLITGNYVHYKNLNLDPYIWDKNVSDSLNKINILGNIILFIPLTILYRGHNNKTSKKFFKSIFIAFILSLVFEISQFIFQIGITDINDIIFNTLGGIIGSIIYSFMSLFLSKDKVKKVISTCGGLIGVLLICIFILINISTYYK